MGYFDYRSRKPFQLALLLSLLVHAAVLLLKIAAPGVSDWITQSGEKKTAQSRLDISLAPPKKTVPQVMQPRPAETPKTPKNAARKPREILALPKSLTSPRTWTRAQRDEMDNFLNELKPAAPPPPKTSADMAQQALAMARQIGRQPQTNDEESAEQATSSKAVEPFSLQMYFDAFIRKLNQSAAFIKDDPSSRGIHKALVKITLNPNGTLKSYRILRVGDQQKQIAYIKRVIDLASPFSPFPSDIRDAMNAFSIFICIYPAREGEGGGSFLRSSGGAECND
ncbi:MAG: hypothetical protein WAX67_01490 [Rugosibacter sp.]